MPSAAQRTRSPVRYIRASRAGERVGDEALRGELGTVEVARATPPPPMYSSPGTPTGTGRSRRVQHVAARALATGRPMETTPGARLRSAVHGRTRRWSPWARTGSTAAAGGRCSASASSRGQRLAAAQRAQARARRPAGAAAACARSRGVACITVAPRSSDQPRQQRGGVHHLVAAGDHHARARDQRQEQLEDGDVERDGGHGQHHVVRRHPRRRAPWTARKLEQAPCSTTTALGRPVEPEV